MSLIRVVTKIVWCQRSLINSAQGYFITSEHSWAPNPALGSVLSLCPTHLFYACVPSPYNGSASTLLPFAKCYKLLLNEKLCVSVCVLFQETLKTSRSASPFLKHYWWQGMSYEQHGAQPHHRKSFAHYSAGTDITFASGCIGACNKKSFRPLSFVPGVSGDLMAAFELDLMKV